MFDGYSRLGESHHGYNRQLTDTAVRTATAVITAVITRIYPSFIHGWDP